MASNFPGGLDNLTNPTATDTLDSATVPHASQHANANDAIEAIESTLGVNPQGGSATVVARLNGIDSAVSTAQTTASSAQSTANTAVTNAATAQSTANAKVASVTPGDSTITVAGTATAPTVAVGTVPAGQVSGLATSATTDTTNASNISSGTLPNARLSAVPNSALANSSVTVNGSSVALGSSVTVTATPTDGTVTDAKIASAGLAQSSLNGVAITAWNAATAYAKGALVEYRGVAYRRAVAGTTSTDPQSDTTNWQQVTPTATTGGLPFSLAMTDGNGFLSSATISALTYRFAVTGPGGATVVKGGTSSTTESFALPDNSGTLIGTGDTGTVTSAMIADGTIVNADINASAAIAQSKIAQPGWRFIPASGVDIVPRLLTTGSRSLASGTAYFAAFIPDTTITITSLEFNANIAGAANATTPTHRFNVGIFTVNAGGTKPTSLTCQTWSQRSSTTTTMAAFGTLTGTQSFALGYTVATTGGGTTTNTNGAPTSITLNAGTTYWIGIHAYANAGFSTGAAIGGVITQAYQYDPYVNIGNSSQSSTDFAVGTNVSINNVFSTGPFCRLNP